MLGFMILTVSDVERSLAFYEAALKPLNIRFFLPYKGKDGHPDLWGFGDGKQAFFWLQQGNLPRLDSLGVHGREQRKGQRVLQGCDGRWRQRQYLTASAR